MRQPSPLTTQQWSDRKPTRGQRFAHITSSSYIIIPHHQLTSLTFFVHYGSEFLYVPRGPTMTHLLYRCNIHTYIWPPLKSTQTFSFVSAFYFVFLSFFHYFLLFLQKTKKWMTQTKRLFKPRVQSKNRFVSNVCADDNTNDSWSCCCILWRVLQGQSWSSSHYSQEESLQTEYCLRFSSWKVLEDTELLTLEKNK